MNKHEPLVAIIILNWNGADDTLACIASLQKLSYRNNKIVVVDNSSDGNDIKQIQSAFGDTIEIIENKNNDGFAKGNNIGMKWAKNKYDPDYYWLINNDTEVDTHALTELIKTVSNNKFDIVGSQIRYWDSSKIYCLGGGKLNLWTGIDSLWGAKIDYHNSYIPNYQSFICGCSLLLSKSILESVSGFDEDYFLYSEDVDLCVRARRKGYELGYSSDSIVFHKSSQTSGYHSPTYIYYFLRNKLIFMKKNANWWHWLTFIPIFLIYYCGGFAWLSWKKNRRIPLRIIIKSIADFIAGRWSYQTI
jgi:GT2 family glycosyltransferase